MLTMRYALATLFAGLAILGTDVASGQGYPNRPVRIITGGTGGTTDLASRLIAQGLTPKLGQPVVVDNRPNGLIAAEIVAKAPPDGYNLILYGSVMWLAPFMQDKVTYDPVKDFEPITLAISSPTILVVHTSVPAKTVKELIALAKAKPGALNYSSGSAGGSSHLAAELFNSMAGVNIVRIAYKGTGDALNGLLGGQVQLMFSSAPSVVPQVAAGKLRALGVTSAEPSALVPGLPTVAASGLPGYDASTIYGVFAPARTAAPLIKLLHQEIVRVLNAPEVQTRFHNVGVDVIAGTPQQFAIAVKSDMTSMGKLIKDIGIRAE